MKGAEAISAPCCDVGRRAVCAAGLSVDKPVEFRRQFSKPFLNLQLLWYVVCQPQIGVDFEFTAPGFGRVSQ
jgi:hypothetical protein